MSDNPGQGGQLAAILDRAIRAISAEGTSRLQTLRASTPGAPGNPSPEPDTAQPAITAFERVGLSISVGAVKRFAMTVSGRIESPAGGPGFDPAEAQAVCTITDRNAPDEPALQGALKMGEDGRFTFTVLLEAWPEDRYPHGRLFVITVRARDRAGTLGESTTYLRIPPPAPPPTPPTPRIPPSETGTVVPDALAVEAAARPRRMALPLYVKGLHLAVKELKDERKPAILE